MPRKKKHLSYDGTPVGYKKPPAEHQFKKGGRKPEGSGRKAGDKNSGTIITTMFDETVSVPVNGIARTMNKREYLIRVAYEKAIKTATSIHEMVALVRMYEKLAPNSIDPPPPLMVESIPGDEGL